MFTAGTSLWSCLGSRLLGARVSVGPNTSARLAEPILLSDACRDTLDRGQRLGLGLGLGSEVRQWGDYGHILHYWSCESSSQTTPANCYRMNVATFKHCCHCICEASVLEGNVMWL